MMKAISSAAWQVFPRNSGAVSWFRSQRLRPMQQVRPVMFAPAISAAALPAVPGLQPEPGLR
jgi:hypothetical protein